MKKFTNSAVTPATALAILFLLTPFPARADGIGIPLLARLGTVILIPLLAFQVPVEAFLISRGFRIPYRRALKLFFVANVVSLLAGIPTFFINGVFFSVYLPKPMPEYFAKYPQAAVIEILFYFVVTVISEFIVVVFWLAKTKARVGLGRAAAFTLLANVITYAVLGPLDYYITKPSHDIRKFTSGTEWAATPLTKIHFMGEDDRLYSIMSNGSGRKLEVPDEVNEYQYLADTNYYLYTNAQNELCLFHPSYSEPRVLKKLGKTRPGGIVMPGMACSAYGETVVAFIPAIEYERRELMLYSSALDKWTSTGIMTEKKVFRPMVQWTTTTSTILIKQDREVTAFDIADSMSVRKSDNAATSSIPLAHVYEQGSDYYYERSRDEHGKWTANVLPGLGSYISIYSKDEFIRIADDPGLLRLGGRFFNTVGFLENGRELVFHDGSDIYLLDLPTRKVGRICRGSAFIVPKKSFEKSTIFAR